MKINVYRIIDKFAGELACGILGLIASRKLDTKKIGTVLVIKLWAVGESILTLPMIDAIKKEYPAAKITILARNRNKTVYEGQPAVDEIILLEPRNIFKIISSFKKFDFAIDCEPYLNISALTGRWLAKQQIGFSHGIRARLYNQKIQYNDQQHVVKTYLDLAGLLGIRKKYDKLLELKYDEQDNNSVQILLKENKISKKDFVVGICASVAESGKDRMWPNEYYAEVINELTKKYNAKIILTGGKNDYEQNEAIKKLCNDQSKTINFAGKTTLKQLFALVKNCKLFISNDTGPMHVAAAQGVRTIGLFGPNLPTRFAPYGKNISLYVKQECSPCINVHQGKFPECTNPIKGKCLKELAPKMVLEAVKKCAKQ